MKVYISADLEGINGVVNERHVARDGDDYQWAREMMTAEVNSAIKGALKAGATEILVNDSHDTMTNIILDKLHPAACLISGGQKQFSMMEGIREDFAAAFFVGYHGRRGTARAVMDHTYSGVTILDVQINRKSMGETGLNALLAGYYQVPVVLVTGDQMLSTEVKELLGEEVSTVVVKEGLGRYSARCLPLQRSRQLIEEAAEKALLNKAACSPYFLEAPYELKVKFPRTAMADYAELLPGVKREGPITISLTADDYPTIYKAFRALLILAYSGR
ncbi:MAG: M55 family metallopeptidase [Halanaerobium sp.]|nr:M55 family metallopeptidase [Halanaerobium sp.]